MDTYKHNLEFLIQSCKKQHPAGQKRLYELFYSYGMGICRRYTYTREEAHECLNDGFFKVFTRIDQYDPEYPFKSWFRKIMVNASIDFYRKHHGTKRSLETIELLEHDQTTNNIGLEQLAYEDVLKLVQKLPPSYRVVFNLYVIEGYKHHEIAERLGISVGTSKSNLAVAKQKLRKMIGEQELKKVK